MLPQWTKKEAEVGLELKMVYLNKPFPHDKTTQVLEINTGMVVAETTRKVYNELKKEGRYAEKPLPKEEGLMDWRGLLPNE